jgi:hypothetical protein
MESPASNALVSHGKNTDFFGWPPDSTSLKKLSAPSASLSNLSVLSLNLSSSAWRQKGTKRLAARIKY